MFDTLTYRFLYDPQAARWRVPTPRRWQQPGRTKRGFLIYDIRGCPDWETRADIARQLPTPPTDRFFLSFDQRHYWSNRNENHIGL
jgi:hypothetical protein